MKQKRLIEELEKLSSQLTTMNEEVQAYLEMERSSFFTEDYRPAFVEELLDISRVTGYLEMMIDKTFATISR